MYFSRAGLIWRGYSSVNWFCFVFTIGIWRLHYIWKDLLWIRIYVGERYSILALLRGNNNRQKCWDTGSHSHLSTLRELFDGKYWYEIVTASQFEKWWLRSDGDVVTVFSLHSRRDVSTPKQGFRWSDVALWTGCPSCCPPMTLTWLESPTLGLRNRRTRPSSNIRGYFVSKIEQLEWTSNHSSSELKWIGWNHATWHPQHILGTDVHVVCMPLYTHNKYNITEWTYFSIYIYASII